MKTNNIIIILCLVMSTSILSAQEIERVLDREMAFDAIEENWSSLLIDIQDHSTILNTEQQIVFKDIDILKAVCFYPQEGYEDTIYMENMIATKNILQNIYSFLLDQEMTLPQKEYKIHQQMDILEQNMEKLKYLDDDTLKTFEEMKKQN